MGEFGGKYVKNEYYNSGEAPEKSIDVEIAIKLKEENKAFKVEKYEHSYPHCWRTDKPILYYPLDSWFIAVTKVKSRMVELNTPSIGNQNLPVKDVLETGLKMQTTGIYLDHDIGEYRYHCGEPRMEMKLFV